MPVAGRGCSRPPPALTQFLKHEASAAAARRLPPAPRAPDPAAAPAAAHPAPKGAREGRGWKYPLSCPPKHRAPNENHARPRSGEPPWGHRAVSFTASSAGGWDGFKGGVMGWARGEQGPTFKGAPGPPQAGSPVRREPCLRRASPPCATARCYSDRLPPQPQRWRRMCRSRLRPHGSRVGQGDAPLRAPSMGRPHRDPKAKPCPKGLGAERGTPGCWAQRGGDGAGVTAGVPKIPPSGGAQNSPITP